MDTQSAADRLAFDVGTGREWMVRETLHHGDTYIVRDFNLRSWRGGDIMRLLTSSPYTYATAAPAETVAKFATDLHDTGRAAWGWSWFELVALEEEG